jgi:hypothetical protein
MHSNDETSLRSRSFGLLLALLVEEFKLVLGDQGKGTGASEGLKAHVLSQFGCVSLEAIAFAGATHLDGAETDDAGVDSASNAVVQLDIDLGDVEVLLVKGVVVLDISLGRAVNKVAHLESLDGLVLGDVLATSAANDRVRVALVLLVPSVISSFDWHSLIIIKLQRNPSLLIFEKCTRLNFWQYYISLSDPISISPFKF